MKVFKSLQHYWAVAVSAVVKEAKRLPGQLEHVEQTRTVVEAVSAQVAPQVVPIEDAMYAVFGCVLAAIHAGGDAAKAKLADAGLDVVAIQKAEAAYASVPQLAAVASALTQ